ncbi:serine/threonine-protein kinase [Lyngbya sp. CCY1209]|uniref:serine/threonine-protein kinase n=1 Tax=Lyngbya sp. CCY1209 TaxID=2886103 RepID=UPI002D20BE30|nr:serine/threonine-protein kinase [Lyngbya sp. CCY1209]MEB3884646.1 serine/threonine protein kinase [Lyngbya sp. CCY1209]
MSYCFNPHCQDPENAGEGESCQICDFPLTVSPSNGSPSEIGYRALQLLGQGGFGRTFLAVNQSDLSRVAIKQFFPQGNNATRAAALFRQEAEQLEILGQHPQIPTRVTYFEREQYQYLVQEFIPGNNLAKELSDRGSFDEEEIAELLRELLPVLQFIHGHRVIHRDIKPENIIRRRSATAKDKGPLVLVDFGAAKVVTGGLLPKTGTVIGSAAYTAPEQLMGKAIFASDLYSLGVTCIHLMTGVPPFDLFDSQEGNWVWRDYLKTPVSDELGRILDGMLTGATSRRFHSAAAVLRKLQPKPKYVEAMPGLKVDLETGFEENITPQKSPKLPPKQVSVPTQEQKITRILESALRVYRLKIQVNRTGKQQLTIVLNRPKKRLVNYQKIAQAIAAELSQLNLTNIRRVKLLGRVKSKGVPEWEMVLKSDPKARINNQLLRLKEHPLYAQFTRLQTWQYWRSQFRQKTFWMDVLMLAMVAYTFSQHLIIFTPLLAVLVAPLFVAVKTFTHRHHGINENPLFGTIALLFIAFGLLNIRIWSDNIFGLILASLFVSMPMFYSQGN